MIYILLFALYCNKVYKTLPLIKIRKFCFESSTDNLTVRELFDFRTKHLI